MGNCQQCTQEVLKQDNHEIVIQKNPNKKAITHAKQFTHKQLNSALKIQAYYKGYLVRKQLTAKYSRSTQQKQSSSVDIHAQQILQKKSGLELFQQTNLSAIEVPQESNELHLDIDNKKFTTQDIKITINNKSQPDEVSQVSSHSQSSLPGGSQLKLGSFNINELCFQPKKHSELQKTQSLVPVTLPQIKMKNGATYEGSWQNGKANGFGRYILLDHSVYTGQWTDNQANGTGTFQHADGEMYVGEWVFNSVCGKGKYHFTDGTFYQGEWLNDLPNGEGTQTFPGGWTYTGTFKNGGKQGLGKLIFPDGAVYTGNFEFDQIYGQGTLIYNDGRIYEGEWWNNKMHGKGIFDWPDGRKYDGMYGNDKRNGFGTYYWSSGQKYMGLWKDGLQHGNGKIISPDGKTLKGTWVKGKFVSRKSIALPGGKSKIASKFRIEV